MPPELESMSSDRAQQNAALFGAVSSTYDELGFLSLAAQFFAEQVPVQPGQRVLDVGSGTGAVALALAKVGAQVTGVDLSPEMVALARQKTQGIANVDFVVADAMTLPFAEASFEVVVCAASLFFMPDMPGALREWKRTLKPGGWLWFSSFGRGLLGDFPGLWREELAAFGLKPPSPPLGRIPTPDAATQLLEQSGFQDVQARLSNRPYPLADPQQRWAEITAGLEGASLKQLPAQSQLQAQQQHLARLHALNWPQTVNVPVMVACGRRSCFWRMQLSHQ